MGARQGDVVDIVYQVLRGNGYYMYSLGLGASARHRKKLACARAHTQSDAERNNGADKEPGQRDLGETYKLTLGRHEVDPSSEAHCHTDTPFLAPPSNPA